ncbi:hypothetical protein FJ366_00055 [Candidatus Dependentiae bacterium]|nr:hypothetical protein [Candidatus Dependentiae bacterium]
MKNVFGIIALCASMTLITAQPAVSAETLISQGKNIINNFAEPKAILDALNQLKAGISFNTPSMTEILNKLKISSSESAEAVLETPYLNDNKTNSIVNWSRRYEENKAEYTQAEESSALAQIMTQLKTISDTQDEAADLSARLKTAFDSK